MGESWAGRNVVVTGGAGALGGAVVEALLAAGAICHVPRLHGGEAAASERLRYRDGVNLSDEDAVGRFYAELPGLWASLHLAGGFAVAPIASTSLADLRSQWELNAVTCFLACREAVKRMRAGGGGGRIVNVAARPVLVPAGGMLAYTSSKAVVASLTQCLAEELKDEGILVNAVVPSIIDTPANRRAMPTADHSKWPRPAELAETMLFLASPANTLTTGVLLPVYGRD